MCMKTLNELQMRDFIDKYFKEWDKDIFKVSVVEHDDIYEYLINEHYLFCVNK